MPPFAPLLVSDAELAIVYHWLDGADAVRIPFPITITLENSAGVLADGENTADTEIGVTAAAAATTSAPGAPVPASVQYRATLLTQANAPMANHPVQSQVTGREGWSTIATDEHGEAPLTSDQGTLLTTRLRIALAAGRYAVIVEATDDTAPGGPAVVGMASAVLRVE